MKGIMDWIDDRSGIRGLVKEALYEKVPGGARWRYVWGSCLTFVFFTQVVTGTLLWMFYSPSTPNRVGKCLFFRIPGCRWLVFKRGSPLHGPGHDCPSCLHLMQVVIDGAYKAPRS